MNETLIVDLQQQLRADIQRIHQPGSSTATTCRMEALAEHSPAFIALLAEPWLKADITECQRELLTNCTRIHLYARVLDDAIDEAAHIQRQHLLRAQPLFWQSVQRIGSLVSESVAQEAVALIEETVTAVQSDDQRRNPRCWGAKNHHLLLIPLLLSDDSPAYRDCRSGLSTMIALVQAGDEWRQGEFNSELLHADFLTFLADCLDVRQLESLSRHGWMGAAERIAWNARQLLDCL